MASRRDRITPARAGKTPAELWKSKELGDHPRSCGKDIIMSILMMIFLGSPPLVRERPTILEQGTCAFGITPARAGKTCQTFTHISRNEDHPRSCGKDFHLTSYIGRKQGSPPLVRERLYWASLWARLAGITPARAGKTKKMARLVKAGKGSPPLVRERHSIKLCY